MQDAPESGDIGDFPGGIILNPEYQKVRKKCRKKDPGRQPKETKKKANIDESPFICN